MRIPLPVYSAVFHLLICLNKYVRARYVNPFQSVAVVTGVFVQPRSCSPGDGTGTSQVTIKRHPGPLPRPLPPGHHAAWLGSVGEAGWPCPAGRWVGSSPTWEEMVTPWVVPAHTLAPRSRSVCWGEKKRRGKKGKGRKNENSSPRLLEMKGYTSK